MKKSSFRPKFSNNSLLFQVFTIFLLGLYLIFLLQPINLHRSDLGRHITNGRVLLEGQTQVLYTNLYSFTMPTQKFINHHWLFGVLVYLTDQIGGDKLVHLTHSFVLLVTAIVTIKLMSKNSSPKISLWMGIGAVLLLSNRNEIRPESIGLLFASLVLLKIEQVIQLKKINWQDLAWLGLMQLIWVNTHISFFISLMFFSFLLASSILGKSPQLSKQLQKKLFGLIIFLCTVSLINPNFIAGFLHPLSIFANYGYRVLENQNLTFLSRMIISPTIHLYFGIAPLLLLAMLTQSKKTSWYHNLLATTGLAMGWLALRNIPLMVIMTFPVVSRQLYLLVKAVLTKIKLEKPQMGYWTATGILFAFTFVLVAGGQYHPAIRLDQVKLGYGADQIKLKEYLQKNPPQEPIFNNYDLGSYLIYSLYPQEKVFIDNRPEAYSVDFFQKEYIPMQEDNEFWLKQLDKYQFKTIIFDYTDLTPWSQIFYKHRLVDPDWKQVYMDSSTVVLEKQL